MVDFIWEAMLGRRTWCKSLTLISVLGKELRGEVLGCADMRNSATETCFWKGWGGDSIVLELIVWELEDRK